MDHLLRNHKMTTFALVPILKSLNVITPTLEHFQERRRLELQDVQNQVIYTIILRRVTTRLLIVATDAITPNSERLLSLSLIINFILLTYSLNLAISIKYLFIYCPRGPYLPFSIDL